MFVTLCMIVKNESSIIRRCLESTKNVIDAVSIVDTGSTDNTKEIIKTWCLENNIKFSLKESQFVDFGFSRTESYEYARKCFPESDYFLLCDADMVLSVTPDFDKEKDIFGDSISVIQKNKFIEYWNVRMIKNIPGWKSIGVTHEYTHNPDAKYTVQSRKLFFIDEEDGGCKTDKYDRDIMLLSREIEMIENDCEHKEKLHLLPRYYFYLAQSYKDRNQTKDDQYAIIFYKKCASISSWNEEKYIAFMNLGKLYARRSAQKPEAEALMLQAYMNAHEARPERYEIFAQLAAYYNNVGKFSVALLFTKEDALFYKTDDHLFNNMNECLYTLPIERTVSLARLGKIPQFLSETKRMEDLWKSLPTTDKIKESLDIIERNKNLVLGLK